MKLRRIVPALAALALVAQALPSPARAEVREIRFARQYGLGYLPLLVLEDQKLIERRAAAAGLGDVKVTWAILGGGAPSNDALLSGSVDYISTGVAPLVLLWAKSGGKVKGVAALGSTPVVVNTVNPAVRTVADFGEKDRIALPSVKVSIQAVVLQIAAEKAFGAAGWNRLDPLTVSLKHPDAAAAILSGRSEITAHVASPPFVEQELADKRVHAVLSSYDLLGGPHTFNVLSSTQAFADANPKTFAVVYDALAEAIAWIRKNPKAAAETYLRVSGSKEPLASVLAQVQDPTNEYTTTPKRVGVFADFMARVGTAPARPKGWRDLFFPTVHGQPGS
ncbi:MAG TPA: ABC transporter substrate-binding protein [Anaeromyxobacteraceae bacterium]|nr:ABC transporter substrate-binding protein [Anaeromyxobacteraceae bacterium]